MARVKYDIVVVGAGPIGLAAAWQLAQKGHRINVLERKSTLDAHGGDIQMSPNATLLSRKIGLAPLLEDIANPKHYATIHDNDPEMSIIMDIPLDLGNMIPSLMFRRADLQRRLYEVAIKDGVVVRFGKQVVSLIDSASRPELTLADSEKVSADLIVAADGVRSTVRTLAFPKRDTRPVALEEVCFQWSVPYSTLATDPDTLSFWEDAKRCCGLVIGSGTYLTYWANETHQELFLIFTKTKYEGPVEVGAWNKPANTEEIRCLLQGYPRAVQLLIDNCHKAEHWRIVDSVKGADWVTPGRRIVLVGDAKHAMPPHQAQGIGQGLEDITALAEFIGAATSADDLSRLMPEFGNFRDPRVELILAAARRNSALFSLPPGEARDRRDAAWRQYAAGPEAAQAWKAAQTSWEDVAHGGGAANNISLLKWIQTYDVLEEAQRHIDRYLLKSSL